MVTGAVLILTAACGMPIGYSAVLLPQLSNTTDPLMMGVEMASWVASIHSAATPIGSFTSGPTMDRCGRRTALLISIIPLVGGWTCIALASSHVWLLVGRILAGIAVGLISAPVQVIKTLYKTYNVVKTINTTINYFKFRVREAITI